ncbi:MAG: dephospho-CoA kinase [Armatimonadetes bacterium]|nr:dephospho-CoA kinase [Armatimonadota bacterium]
MALSVGLTGGIASGKSTVLAMLAERGARTVSADGIVHRLLAESLDLKDAVCRAFGQAVLDQDGAVDRAALAKVVFSDETRRKRLEALVHPLVRSEVESWLAEDTGIRTINVAEIPLLFETGSSYSFDLTVVVWTQQNLQLRRLQNKYLDPVEAQSRIAAQMSLDEKAVRADFVVHNCAGLAELSAETDKLWVFLTERLTAKDRGLQTRK